MCLWISAPCFSNAPISFFPYQAPCSLFRLDFVAFFLITCPLHDLVSGVALGPLFASSTISLLFLSFVATPHLPDRPCLSSPVPRCRSHSFARPGNYPRNAVSPPVVLFPLLLLVLPCFSPPTDLSWDSCLQDQLAGHSTAVDPRGV
jgi:hypothetical protein